MQITCSNELWEKFFFSNIKSNEINLHLPERKEGMNITHMQDYNNYNTTTKIDILKINMMKLKSSRQCQRNIEFDEISPSPQLHTPYIFFLFFMNAMMIINTAINKPKRRVPLSTIKLFCYPSLTDQYM